MPTAAADSPAGLADLSRLAGDLVRRARRARGLSQRALAAAAGVSPTVVARIETGKTQPTLATLGRLLAGADFAPSVELVNTARPSELIAAHKPALLSLAEQHGVRSVQVFGSVAVGTDRPDSDLDLLVEFEPGVSGLARVDFAEAVADLLGVRVDMVNPASANARFLRRIEPQLRSLDGF